MLRNTSLILLIPALILPLGGVRGQEPYSPMVRGGSVRLQVSPIFSTFSSRFGVDRTTGSIVEGEETLGSDFTASTLGSTIFPALAGFEDAVRAASAGPFDLNLGSLATVLEKTQVRVPLSVDIGINDWLNVGASVPLVQSDAALALDFSADSALVNAGLSPGLADPFVTDAFLADFQTAITAFEATQLATCQASPGSPACFNATALLSNALGVQGALATMYQTFFLAPFAGTTAAAAIEARLGTIASGFSAAGVVGTPVIFPVASTPLSLLDFQALVTDARFGTGGSFPLQRTLNQWAIGDVELRLTARLLNIGEGKDTDFRLAAGGGVTYRLGTGFQDDPANFLDTGTGDGQDDIEVRGWLNTQLTRRIGVWADLRYGIQQSGSTVRRVFDPDFAIAPADTRFELEWSPGDYRQIEVAPWLRIGDELTLIPVYRYFNKAEDTFSLTGGPAGSPDPQILSLETEATLQEFAVGLIYNTVRPRVGEAPGSGFEFRGMYRAAVSGSGGQVPKAQSFEAGFRLFLSLWGS